MEWVIAGAVLQILGLVLAAVGLAQTWAENPKPENLLRRIFGPAVRWVGTKVLGRPPRVHSASGGVRAEVKITGSAFGHRPLDASAPLADQIAHVDQQAVAARREAHQAHTLAERTDQRVTDLAGRLEEEIARVRTDLETTRKADAADAVPLATIGLMVTAVGTILGLVGSLVTA